MKGGAILLAVVLFGFYAFVQLHFLSFYNIFGLPFGKSDVDIYMGQIGADYIANDHVLLNLIPLLFKGIVDPGLFYTVVIPLSLCVFLPLTLFVFAVYYSRDQLISFVAVFMLVFGTFSFQVYGFSALWAQLYATVFSLWSVVFFQHWTQTKKNVLLLVVGMFAVLSVLSHVAGAGFLALFVGFYFCCGVRNRVVLAVLIILAVFVLIFMGRSLGEMFGDYIYEVDLSYVMNGFAMAPVWVLAFFGMALEHCHNKKRSLIYAVLATLLISPAFVLWRPIISVLPVISYFAAVGFISVLREAYRKGGAFFTVLIVVIFSIYLVEYSMGTTRGFIKSMLWEMEAEPGLVDRLPRALNGTVFRDIYFGGDHSCVGELNTLTGEVTERCR
jgi:hypothetical protein